jgi:hypothetical protein
MRTALALLFSVSMVARAQDDPKDLLLRVSQKVMDSIHRLPRYLCTLTIERSQYKTGGVLSTHSCDNLAAEKKAGHLKRSLYASDRLRLDVAIGTSREIFGTTNEMYSWVGDNRFDNRGLFDLVRQGAISSGSFSTFLISIFGEDRATFSYNGDITENGRQLSEFGFQVPLEKSNYVYSFGNNRTETVRTAAEGTFLADSNTFDLVRLTIHRALPPNTDACETAETFDYQQVSLGGSSFLLARKGLLDILSPGDEMENHMDYSACREFTGQSTLTFDTPSQPSGSISATSDPAAAAFALPPGQPFKLAFTEPIDTAVVAAGDPIRAKLTTAILSRSAQVLVPNGAIVLCRIMKAEHLYGNDKAFVLGVKVESIMVGGTSLPLKAAPDSGARRFTKGEGRLTQRIDLGPLVVIQDLEVAVFEFPFAHPKDVIKSGMISSWLTLAP